MAETPITADGLRQWLIDEGRKWTRYASASSHRGHKRFEVQTAEYGHETFRVIHNETNIYAGVNMSDAISIYNAIQIFA